MEKFLTIKEACKMLSISVPTIRRWIKKNKLPCYKIGNEYKFFESDLKEFVNNHKINK